jgi:hypothetical protein
MRESLKRVLKFWWRYIGRAHAFNFFRQVRYYWYGEDYHKRLRVKHIQQFMRSRGRAYNDAAHVPNDFVFQDGNGSRTFREWWEKNTNSVERAVLGHVRAARYLIKEYKKKKKK